MLINVKQQTPEWHALRRNKIGASDAPVIMEESPWKTPYQLWMEKLGLSEGQNQTPAMRYGLDLEDEVRKKVEAEIGQSFDPAFAISDEHYFMAASLDGLSVDRKSAIEIKCPGFKDHQVAISGEIPLKYKAQLHHQMMVLQIPEIYYCSFKKDAIYEDLYDLRIVIYKFDENYAKSLINAEIEFWNGLQELKPPQLNSKDYVNHNDDGWLEDSKAYVNAQLMRKKYEEEENIYKNKLIERCEGKNCIGGGVKLVNVARKGNVEYSAIPELQNVDLEKYRKPTSSYVKISVDK